MSKTSLSVTVHDDVDDDDDNADDDDDDNAGNDNDVEQQSALLPPKLGGYNSWWKNAECQDGGILTQVPDCIWNQFSHGLKTRSILGLPFMPLIGYRLVAILSNVFNIKAQTTLFASELYKFQSIKGLTVD